MSITLSLSSVANHLTTQLYNEQEAHLPYTKLAPRLYDNSVFLSASKNRNGTTNYSPRAVVFDLNGGFGGSARYEVDPASVSGVEIVTTAPRVPKHTFQTKLDAGVDDAETLKESQPRFWTDYNKLLYRPLALVLLLDWNSGSPYGTNRNFSRLKFDTFSVGWEEYSKYQETSIDEFRRYLEEVDNLQGINLFSDYNSGWGGFTSHLLLDLKDEFFNNGANSKHNIWVYGLAADHGRMDVNQKCSSIAAFVELARHLSLFLPIVPSSTSPLLVPDFDPKNNWHQGALCSLLVNSMWELHNRQTCRVSMDEIEAKLVCGTNRTIVNEMQLKCETNQSSCVESPNSVADVSREELLRLMEQGPVSQTSVLNMGLLVLGHDFSRVVITEEKNDSHKDAHLASFSKISSGSTFPPLFKTARNGHFAAEFAVTSGMSAILKDQRKFLQRVKHNENLSDREELIEDISEIIEEYKHGYEDSDEEFDV